MTVRQLGPGEEALCEDACRLFGLEGDIDATEFLSRPESVLFVAEDVASLAGWAYGHELIHPDGERTMVLYMLDVDEPMRRRGHGRALVEAFVEHARARGCTEVWLLSDDGNPAAIATYRSAGGKRDGLDQVMFTWRLADGRHSS